MRFEDNFSAQAKQYAQFRPQYPQALYVYLATVVPGHLLAWDCGTGSGQAAIGLAEYFERVYATDASAEQIAHARPHRKVEYHVESAVQVGLEPGSVDLVTVAQAVHWFDLDHFYGEVKRVLKPNGVVVMWTYGLPEISPQIDSVLMKLYSETLGGFWPERIRYVEEQYRTLPFPFDEITPPLFTMESQWNMDWFRGFIDSWSATQKYREQNGTHPLEAVEEELLTVWNPSSEQRTVRWQIYLRVGQKA